MIGAVVVPKEGDVLSCHGLQQGQPLGRGLGRDHQDVYAKPSAISLSSVRERHGA